MYALGKIVGGLLGMMIAGPVGVLIGVLIGHRFDKRRRRRDLAERYSGHGEAVAAAVSALGAKLAKIDGRVSEAEVRAFRRIFHIPQSEVPRIAELWREAALTPAGYEPYARHLAQMFVGRPDMLRRIFAGLREVVAADGSIGPAQRWALEDVARIFGLGPGWETIRDLEPVELGGAELSAESLSAAYSDLFDNRAADENRQVFQSDAGAPRADLAAILSRPGARDLVAACVFASIALAVVLSGAADGLFPQSGLVLAGSAGALAAWAARALLSRPRPLPEAAEKAASEAGVASSEVASTVEETRAKRDRILTASGLLDPAVRRRIEAICRYADLIVDGLLKDPADVARSRPFLLHYLDATSEVVQRFADLRGRQGAEAQFGPVMDKMGPLLADIEGLFRAHYEHGLKGEALELDVSIDSLQRMIRSEGRNVR